MAEADREPYRLLLIAGTRPEAIKLAPLALAARLRPDLACAIVVTGQHGALCDDALATFGLEAAHRLGPASAGLTMAALEERIVATLPGLLRRLRPDIVVVQGDTTSAWASARVAHHAGYAIAHVEAGLRSGDPLLPWPEERNRSEIDAIADLLLAPCAAAAGNLLAEGARGHIVVTGNSGIDALLHVKARTAAFVGDPARRRLFATCHRRESQGAALSRIAAALRALAAREDVALTVALPGDPAKARLLAASLESSGAMLVAPLDYRATVAHLLAADLVLSDSGGLQEECPALGLPLLVLRDNSERPEAIACGAARLVGTQTAIIVAEATRLLDDPHAYATMARPHFPYGQGEAAPRMLDAIAALAKGDSKRQFA